MKSPAFLFYSQDFLIGCSDLTMIERGQYITLLCLQHQKGHLSRKNMEISIGEISPDVLRKFSTDDQGLFFNERLDKEIGKRKNFCDKQRERIDKRWYQSGNTTVLPIKENENENENEDINEEEKKYKEESRKIQFEQFRKNYPGTKRGFEVEYSYLMKCHKDWKEIIPILNIKLDYQKTQRAKRAADNQFVPEWKNLKTYIYQRAWEEEIPIDKKIIMPITYQEMLIRAEKDPKVWEKFKAVKKEGERVATFYPVE